MASSFVRKKREHSVKSYQEKLQIILFAEENPHLKQKDIAEKYGMKRQTLSDLLRNKELIKAKFSTDTASTRKTVVMEPSHVKVEFSSLMTISQLSRKKRRLRTKSFQEKLEIIKFAEENPGLKQKTIAAKYDMKPQTLSDLLKHKEAIKSKAIESEHLQKNTRQRRITHENADKALILWYREVVCSTGVSVDGETLRQKACQFARQFAKESNDEQSINISASWIERFKKRYGLGRNGQPGGTIRQSSNTCDTWFTVVLPSILHSFCPQDIYSIEESALLWKCLPNEAKKVRVHFRGHYGSLSSLDERVTVLAGANMDGTDRPPIVIICKPKDTEPFRHLKWLPVRYYSSKQACLTKSVFVDYLRSLDGQFRSEGRHVAVILTTSTAHPPDSINGLTNITLFYLPPDAKTHMKPLKTSVFRELKFRYRLRYCKRLLACVEESSPLYYNLTDAVISLAACWNEVRQKAIQHGFTNAGIICAEFEEPEPEPLENTQDFFNFLTIWDRLRMTHGDRDMISLQEFIEIDQGIETADNMSESDIIDFVYSERKYSPTDGIFVVEPKMEPDVDDDSRMLSERPLTPTKVEALTAADILRRYFLSHGNLESLNFDLQDIEDAVLSPSNEVPEETMHI